MLPHTHLLVGLMLGMLAWKNDILTWELAIVVGLIAALIDIDHLYAYHKHHRDWSIKGAWLRALKFHEPERTIIHHAYGFIAITILLIILGVFSPIIMIVGGLAYYSHYFLDHVHVKYEGLLRREKVTIPLSYLEMMLDMICISVVLILAFI